MQRRLITPLTLLFLFLAIPFARADSYVPTLTYGDAKIDRHDLGSMQVIDISITAEGAGGDAGKVSDLVLPFAVDGLVYQVETDPGGTAPTADYDLTLTSGGLDIMGGSLADRSNTLTQRAFPATGSQATRGSLTLTVANQSVASATFSVRIYYFDTGM